jgi:hypothetical protein
MPPHDLMTVHLLLSPVHYYNGENLVNQVTKRVDYGTTHIAGLAVAQLTRRVPAGVGAFGAELEH